VQIQYALLIECSQLRVTKDAVLLINIIGMSRCLLLGCFGHI